MFNFPATMDKYRAVAIVEGFEPVETEEEFLAAAQYLVDTGLAWTLQGLFGRVCKQLIDAGLIEDR